MDYSEVFKKPEQDLSQEVIPERAVMFSLTQDKDYPTVLEELTTQGSNSETQQSINATAASKNLQQENLAKEAIVADTDISDEDKISALSITKLKPTDYVQELADKLRMDTKGLSEREIAQNLSRYLAERDTTLLSAIAVMRKFDVEQDSAMRREIALKTRLEAQGQTHKSEDGTQIPGYDAGTTFEGAATATTDFFGEMIPGNAQRIWLGLYDHMLGEYPAVSSELDKWVMAGRPQEDIKEYLKTLPIDQLEDQLRKAKDYVLANSGFLMETNDTTADHVLNGLMEDLIYQEDRDLDEAINSFVSILDTTFIGSVTGAMTKQIVRMGKGLGSAALKPILGINTKKRKEIADAIREGKITAEELGTTQPLLDMALISLKDEGMPNDFLDALIGAKAVADDVADTMAHNSLTPGQVGSAEEGLSSVIADGYTNIVKGNTNFKREGNDIRVDFLVGEGPTNGFKSMKDALDLANKTSDDYTIVFKSESNELIDVPKQIGNIIPKTDIQGEFFVRFNQKMSIPDANLMSKSVKVGEKDIRGSGWGRLFHRIFSDSTNSLSRRLSLSIDSALDMSEGAAGQLRSIVKPYTDLNLNDQTHVLHTINEFIKQGKPITYASIQSMPLSSAQKMGVWSYKLATEANYKIFNSVLRRDYTKQNIKQMKTTWLDDAGKKQEFNTYGKKVDQVNVHGLREPITHNGIEFPSGSVVYYEHSSGSVKYLTEGAVKDLYKDGGYLLRTKEYLGEGDMVASYVIGGKNSKMMELPENVLNHRHAYNSSRIYTSNIYVREKKSIIKDGVREDYYIARAGYDDFGAANKAMLRLAEETGQDASRYKITYAKELTDKESRRLAEDVQMSKGTIGFSKRSENLVEGQGLDGIAFMEDPMTSLSKSIQSITDKGIRGNAIEHLESLWLNTYRHLLPRDQQGYPKTAASISKMIEKGNLSTEAHILFDKIQIFKDLYSSQVDDLLKQGLRKGAAFIANYGESGVLRNQISKGMIKFAEVSPITVLKSIPFQMYIAGNPARQLLLQSQQATFVASQAPGYFPQMVADAVRMVQALHALKLKDADTIYKDKEFLELARQFEKSGILGSLEHSGLAAESVIREASGLTKTSPANYLNPIEMVKGALNLAKKGFIMGEGTHLLSAFLTARKKFHNKNNRWPSSKSEWQRVNADARQLGLSMTPASGMEFSKGLQGLFTQFWSVQQKAVLAMVSNPAYKDNRAALWATQLLLFGTKSFPVLTRVGENVIGDIEMDDELRAAIMGGLYNYGIKKATGQYWDISGSFAPAGGQLKGPLNLFRAVKGDMGMTPERAVPAWGAANKLYKFTTDIAPMIVGMGYHGVQDLETTSGDFLNNFARLSSGWSNYTQARASFAAQQLITKSGRQTDIDDGGTIGVFLRSAGFKLTTEEAARELMEDAAITRVYSNDNLKKDAGHYAAIWREILINSTRGLEDADNTYEIAVNLGNEQRKLEAWVRHAHPEYADAIITNGIDKAWEADNTAYDIVMKIHKKLVGGELGAASEEVRQDVLNKIKDLTPQKQDILDRVIQRLD